MDHGVCHEMLGRRGLERKKAGDQVVAILVHERLENSGKIVFVGVMDLRGLDSKSRTVYSASVIGDKRYWGKGIAHEARLMQLKIAFDDIGLDRVYSRIIRPNVRSQHMLENTGYRLIGVLPEARLVEGVWYDELVYCVSRPLWFPYWNQHFGKGL